MLAHIGGASAQALHPLGRHPPTAPEPRAGVAVIRYLVVTLAADAVFGARGQICDITGMPPWWNLS
jgi:hypothetical protein